MGEGRRADVLAALVGRIGHVIGATTAGAVVAPDVVEVEPMADFMGRRAPQVERWCRRADRAEGGIADDHAIGGCRAAGKLGITQQAAGELADPDVEIPIGRPGIQPAGGLRLDCVVARERDHRGLAPLDARGRRALRVDGGQIKLDAGVGRQWQERRRRVVDVGIGAAEVAVQNGDLAGDLGVRDVLRCGVPHHMHDHRDACHARARSRHVTALVGQRRVLDLFPGTGVFW